MSFCLETLKVASGSMELSICNHRRRYSKQSTKSFQVARRLLAKVSADSLAVTVVCIDISAEQVCFVHFPEEKNNYLLTLIHRYKVFALR